MNRAAPKPAVLEAPDAFGGSPRDPAALRDRVHGPGREPRHAQRSSPGPARRAAPRVNEPAAASPRAARARGGGALLRGGRLRGLDPRHHRRIERITALAAPFVRARARPGGGPPAWAGPHRRDPPSGDARVTSGPRRGLRAVVEIGLEEYVAAVVAAELPIWSAEPAELEAQAIAARTFAVQGLRARRAAGEDLVLTDGVLDQAYRGAYEGTDSARAARARQRLEAAVRATRGLVLLRGDGLEEARYHASCGRHTANFADVFAHEVRALGAAGPAGERCRPCATRAAAEQANGAPDEARPLGWIARLEPGDLRRAGEALGLGGPVTLLAPARVDRAGRWLEVHVAGPDGVLRVEPFDDLRAAIGYGVLKGSAIVTTLPVLAARSARRA